jgi:hypothetical protein
MSLHIYKAWTSDNRRAELVVTFGRETINLTAFYERVESVDLRVKRHREKELVTYRANYSGYTLSECLCKALIEIGFAEDWDEAIFICADQFGVEYESDDEDEPVAAENGWQDEDEVTTTYASLKLMGQQSCAEERARIVALLTLMDAKYDFHTNCRACEAIALIAQENE